MLELFAKLPPSIRKLANGKECIWKTTSSRPPPSLVYSLCSKTCSRQCCQLYLIFGNSVLSKLCRFFVRVKCPKKMYILASYLPLQVGNTESWPMFIHSTFQPLLLFLCNVGMTSTFVLRVRPSVSISILLEKPVILSSRRKKGGRRFYLNSIFMFLDPK